MRGKAPPSRHPHHTMSHHRSSSARPAKAGPWVIDTRDLGRRPGTSRRYHRTPELDHELGFEPVVLLPRGREIEFDVLLESVGDGVLVTGTATTDFDGECARCLDPLTDRITVEFTELFAYAVACARTVAAGGPISDRITGMRRLTLAGPL